MIAGDYQSYSSPNVEGQSFGGENKDVNNNEIPDKEKQQAPTTLNFTPQNPEQVPLQYNQYGQYTDQRPQQHYQQHFVPGIPLYPLQPISDSEEQLQQTQQKMLLSRKFVVQGYKDIWAAILFILIVFLTILFGIINFAQFYKQNTANKNNYHNVEENYINSDNVYNLYSFNGFHQDSNTNSAFASITNTTATNITTITTTLAPKYIIGNFSASKLVLAIFLITLLSIVLSIFCINLFRRYPTQIIIITNILALLILLIGSIISFCYGMIFSGVIQLCAALFNAFILFYFRKHIAFSGALLRISSDIISNYPTLVLAYVLIVIVFFIYCIFWSSMVCFSIKNFYNKNAQGQDLGFVFFGVLFFFWVAQVCTNILHVTTSGVAATWYFVGGNQYMPPNPVLHSLKRACTTSFGSICFGSLLVAILRTLRFIAKTFIREQNRFLSCICVCILGCIENLMVYFNTYAFVYCAIYGYGYIEAARKSYELAQNCFFAAAFNYNLITWTLFITTLAVSCMSFLIFWAGFNLAVGVIAFIITFAMMTLIFRIIDSADITIFVCAAEEPILMNNLSPELYDMLHRTVVLV